MGSSESKATSSKGTAIGRDKSTENTDGNGEVVTSNGFHLFELHTPTMGLSVVTVIALVVGCACLWACLRKCGFKLHYRRRNPTAGGTAAAPAAQPHLPVADYMAMQQLAIVQQQPQPTYCLPHQASRAYNAAPTYQQLEPLYDRSVERQCDLQRVFNMQNNTPPQSLLASQHPSAVPVAADVHHLPAAGPSAPSTSPRRYSRRVPDSPSTRRLLDDRAPTVNEGAERQQATALS